MRISKIFLPGDIHPTIRLLLRVTSKVMLKRIATMILVKTFRERRSSSHSLIPQRIDRINQRRLDGLITDSQV
ncbi:MAG TPA: hypothetical protein DIT99_27370 [Candidatus Latescibacteria bacterium]|nr:hypothetical protein [Candidatus Latescibacterota bacterium]